MSDPAVPIAYLAPIGVAIGAAVAALWARISEVEKRERADCGERVAAVEDRLERLERRNEECEERWRREVQRGAQLFAIASLAEAKQDPELPPPADWDETTAVRQQRQNLEIAAIVRTYARSERPEAPYRPPQKSHRDK